MILMVMVSAGDTECENLLKMGLHRNGAGGKIPKLVYMYLVPPCLLPLPTLWILVWVSSTYVHANKVNEIHNTVFENLLELMGLAR